MVKKTEPKPKKTKTTKSVDKLSDKDIKRLLAALDEQKKEEEEKESVPIDLSKHTKSTYNDWFIFFQKRSKAENLKIEDWAVDNLPSDGYAALRRWLEIYSNPSQMDKIAKAKMEDDNIDDLLKLAIGDDDEKYYLAEIESLFRQLHGSGVSPQEYARLSALMAKARDGLRQVRSRKTKKGSVLEKVMEKADNKTKKQSTPARTTSSKAVGGVKKKKAISKSSKGNDSE